LMTKWWKRCFHGILVGIVGFIARVNSLWTLAVSAYWSYNRRW
jgi:hypothetical protein